MPVSKAKFVHFCKQHGVLTSTIKAVQLAFETSPPSIILQSLSFKSVNILKSYMGWLKGYKFSLHFSNIHRLSFTKTLSRAVFLWSVCTITTMLGNYALIWNLAAAVHVIAAWQALRTQATHTINYTLLPSLGAPLCKNHHQITSVCAFSNLCICIFAVRVHIVCCWDWAKEYPWNNLVCWR